MPGRRSAGLGDGGDLVAFLHRHTDEHQRDAGEVEHPRLLPERDPADEHRGDRQGREQEAEPPDRDAAPGAQSFPDAW